MTDSTVRKVVLPKRIVNGLFGGDAMVNIGCAEDMAAHELLWNAVHAGQPRKQTLVLEGEERLLLHIADYLDGVCEFQAPCKDRFGFTRAEAREAHELMVFQLGE
jgi:hypothetical protein